MNDHYLNKLRDVVLAMPVDYRLKLASVGPGYEFMRQNIQRSDKKLWRPPKVERTPTQALPGLIDTGFALWIPVNAIDIMKLAVEFNGDPVHIWIDSRTTGRLGHLVPVPDPGGYLTALGILALAMDLDPSPLVIERKHETGGLAGFPSDVTDW